MSNNYTSKLKKRKPDPGDFNWDNEWHENEDIEDVVAGALLSKNRVSSGCAVTDGGGLNADYADGYVYVAGELVKITGASKLLTGGSASDDTGGTNWIYVDSAGVVQASTTAPSGDYVPLAMVDCNTLAVLRIADLRPMEPERMVENDCINGTFDIWQRAISQSSSGYGSDDRWRNNTSGSAQAVTQKLFTSDGTASGTYDDKGVPGKPEYYSRTVVTSVAGAGNYVRKEHRVLDVRKYAGKRICVKFHAKADSVKNIALEAVQNFGTGGSAQVDSIGPQKIALSASFDKYVAFVDVPAISTKIIGSLSHTRFVFWFDAGSNYNSRSDTLGQQSGTFDISEVEIYVSDKEVPVRRRTAEEELNLCLPYYRMQSCSYALFSPQSSTTGRMQAFTLDPPMIQIPAVTYSGFTGSGGSTGITPSAAKSYVAARVDGSGMTAHVAGNISFTLQLDSEI